MKKHARLKVVRSILKFKSKTGTAAYMQESDRAEG